MLIILASIVTYAFFLGAIISQFVTSKLNLNFFNSQFSKDIPSFSVELAQTKSYDLLYFCLVIFFTILISFLYFKIVRFHKNANSILDLFNLFFALLFFIQTHFVRYSYTDVLVVFVVIQLIYLGLKVRIKKEVKFINWFIVANGFLTGFFIMLLIRPLSTSLLVTLGVIILSIFLYTIFAINYKKNLEHPAHILLVFSILNSWNVYYLIILGVVTFLLVFFEKKYFEKISKFRTHLYTISFLVLLAFNPNFYSGSIDSVEEGFWFGWLQGLIGGKILYKEIAAYHPPILIWGLDIFTKITDQTMYHGRLYFQLLKVIGVILIFISIKDFLSRKVNLILYTLLILALINPYVKNNIEIRLGLGVFSLFVLYKSFCLNSKRLLLIAGVISAISFFVSIEIGIAAIVASIVGIFFNSFKGGLKELVLNIFYWKIGVLTIFSFIFSILFFQGGLWDFITQMFFYSSAFSSGYFNTPVDRAEVQNILLWWKVDRYLSSTAFFWELALLGISSTVTFLIYKATNKLLDKKDLFLFIVLIFCFIISRAALGRSDIYHLLFILVVSIPLFLYFLESLERDIRSKYISTTALVIFLIVFFRTEFQQVFINDQFFKLQSYANISQRYEILQTPRSKIAFDIDYPVKDTDSLIKFLEEDTGGSDKIFVYPWQPELYFLVDRQNATSFYTPYSFFTKYYQEQMVDELKKNKPKYIIYNSNMNFGGMTQNSLTLVSEYIQENFEVYSNFGKNDVLVFKDRQSQ